MIPVDSCLYYSILAYSCYGGNLRLDLQYGDQHLPCPLGLGYAWLPGVWIWSFIKL